MRFSLLIAILLSSVANVTAELPAWLELADRARWAANAHNMQSWKLNPTPGQAHQRLLVLDPFRLLPQTDPLSRQLTISLGAFLAVVEDEALVRGAIVAWEPLVDQPGALITLTPSAPTADLLGRVDALTAPTVKYRTAAYGLSPETRAKQEALSDPTVSIRWVTMPDEVAATKTWAQKAFDLEMDLPRTRDESIELTRYGEAARKALPWGITLAPNFPQEQLFWIETLAGWFPQSPVEYAKSAKDMMAKALVPISQLVVFTSKGNGNFERLETGRRLQRLWQQVRADGGELLPLSQGLQEFPEMEEFYAEAHRRWAQPGETVQMVLALFRPAPGAYQPSPRLPASALVQ